MNRLLLLAVTLAATAPLVSRPAPSVAPAPGDWPAAWEGRVLVPLAPAPEDARLAAGFPGRIARFTDGERQVVLRRVAAATRRLHPARDCFAALGHRVTPLPMRRSAGGYSSCFEARRGNQILHVCERVFDADGRGFPDVSSWWWAAFAGRSRGPWLAATVVERVAG